ncbi:MAG: GNAT family N-acetyltransferase [Actinomycetota bacterium]|nr:GNAT family N-acetyltransferase [Actinomycetota bacterium]
MRGDADERLAARGDVTVDLVDAAASPTALRLVGTLESRVDAPLVDESERARLQALANAGDQPRRWIPMLARADSTPVGYAGVVVPAPDDAPGGDGGVAGGDLAVDRDRPTCDDATVALLQALLGVTARHGAARLRVWIRHARAGDRRCAETAGLSVDRRLAVLGRRLDRVGPVELPDGVEVRAFRPGQDDDGLVDVLAAAYAGTAEAGWDRQRLDERAGYAWFDPADLLVAEDASGRLVGLHWTKVRPDGTGEVYNLAVHPDVQGSGLGRALLRVGLAHLADRGCGEAILWVDRANEAGVGLYRDEGFTRRWTDVAFVADLTARTGGPTY